METTLHRQLKQHFSDPDSQIEVKQGRYRIDIVTGKQLIEVQLSGLISIRDKIRELLKSHDVEVIKPVIARKQLVQLTRKNGRERSRRWSPLRGSRIDIVHELIHFTSVFPHPRLTLRVPLLVIEEFRTKPKSRQWRRRKHQVHDQKLLGIEDFYLLKTRADLCQFVPADLAKPFDTGSLSKSLDIPRWVAQRYTYCLRKTGAAQVVGKRGNSLLYELNGSRPPRRSRTTGPSSRQSNSGDRIVA